MKVCTQPGCPTLVLSGRCDEHGRTSIRRPSPRSLGYDARWERTRTAYLVEHPGCEWQEEACGAAAKHVDHKDGQGPLGPRGHDWDNLQSLCHSHHSRKTALYDGGFGNRPKPRGGVGPPSGRGFRSVLPRENGGYGISDPASLVRFE
jgi:5-methylcytosine-specific restriction protein A